MAIQLYLPETKYAVASLPLSAYPAAVECIRDAANQEFVSLTRDKQEITLMIAEDVWHQVASHFPDEIGRAHV